MSFRRSDNPTPEGSRWRLANLSLLLECGIPEEVASSDRRWIYVLLHGDDHPGTGWTVSWMSPKQAQILLDALMKDLPCEIGCDLVRLLRKRSSEMQK